SSGYADPSNNLKAIQSRNGNKIIMDDNSGSMFISDNGGSSSLYDGAGNFQVSANSNITLNVGNSSAFVTMDSSGKITIEGNTNIELKVGNSLIAITENDITIDSKTIEVKGKDEINMTSKNNTITGNTKTTIDGMEVAINPTGDVNIQPDGGNVVIKGTEVDIN
ncbi:hypothetical protein IBL28_17255, partial [Sinomicrobium sp. FJxs]|nr:hypothetical protein [Sinomicrobium weinanense]